MSEPRLSVLARSERIDVHAHFLPKAYRWALEAANLTRPDGIARLPDWNEEAALEAMDALAIRTAFLSISSPGIHFGDQEQANLLARIVNDEGAALAARRAGRFGIFASLPLPDVRAAVIEARRALDELQADGVVLSTNHQGLYLGDPALTPLYAELDRRGAVLFIHPTSPSCSCSTRLDSHYPRPMLEFQFETTRSVTDLVLSGVLERFPNIKIIVPHAGAVLSVLADRIELLLPFLGNGDAAAAPSMIAAMRSLHFDLAGAPVPRLLGPLLQLADPAKLLYGSDYPFTPIGACQHLARQIDETELLDPETRRALLTTNAERLFARHFARFAPAEPATI